MKLIHVGAVALATAFLSGAALAETKTGPGQSEFAPGHRAKSPGDAKTFAPGQQMHTKDVKSEPGASEYAPGHQPNTNVKK